MLIFYLHNFQPVMIFLAELFKPKVTDKRSQTLNYSCNRMNKHFYINAIFHLFVFFIFAALYQPWKFKLSRVRKWYWLQLCNFITTCYKQHYEWLQLYLQSQELFKWRREKKSESFVYLCTTKFVVADEDEMELQNVAVESCCCKIVQCLAL